MAYTIYQYANVADNGEPIEPPNVRTASQAFGASVQVADGMRYVAVVPDADMYLRIHEATGQAATSADHKILTGDCRGFPVRPGARPFLYGLAA